MKAHETETWKIICGFSPAAHEIYIFNLCVVFTYNSINTGMLTTEISVQHITPDLQFREESRICDLCMMEQITDNDNRRADGY